ncbi:MAG: hypothetical protein E7570_02185 [Ruminococcaceae bacterium]|nr:hypothetical protein [Oscillospiraceae bacterium]
MFESLIEKYDKLIILADTMPMDMLISCIREFNKERQLMCLESLTTHKINVYDESVKKVKEFVVKSQKDKTDCDEDFFVQIGNIRKEVGHTATRDFLLFYEQGLRILNDKEERLCQIIKYRLIKEPIYFGSNKNKKGESIKISWLPYKVDVINNILYLVSQTGLLPSVYHQSGYNIIEDGTEEFGCAEIACSWRASDLREEMNTWLYNRLFSDDEKQLIVKTHRNVNQGDQIIGNDETDDYLYLLTKEEFENLDYMLKFCPPSEHYNSWYLCEQESRAWDDEDKLPSICAIKCNSETIDSIEANKPSLVRPAMALNLDLFIEKFC